MKPAHIPALALSAALLSACSSLPSYLPWRSSAAPLQVHVNIVSTRNTLGAQEVPSLADMNFPAGDGKPYTINFPMTQSFECDAARTQCKHAVTNTELTVTSEKTGASAVKLTALLRTRTPTNNIHFSEDQASKNQVARITSSDAAAADVQQLSAVLQRGATVELNGNNDIRLKVTVK